jgi:proline-specific peptidase
MADTREATFDFAGRRVWYAVVGELAARPPLVCVPGGPGLPHGYLSPLARLADAGRPVVFYDPLGSGRSERGSDVRWTLATYVDELAQLVRVLGVPRYHLYAHSVAGLAAYPHAIAQPPGLLSLVLASCPASMPRHQAAVRKLLALDGADLAEFEQAERNLIPRRTSYLRTYYRFIEHHFCRLRPLPEAWTTASRGMNRDAHQALKGGWCFYTTELTHWDVTPELERIAAPTLITCGRHDTLSPHTCAELQAMIPRCELTIFEQSSHTPHLEEPDVYLACLERFLDAHD